MWSMSLIIVCTGQAALTCACVPGRPQMSLTLPAALAAQGGRRFQWQPHGSFGEEQLHTSPDTHVLHY